MTDTNYTHIAIILDRSGSMAPIRRDMEGGLNKFIEDQKAVPGKCTISLFQFDDVYETVFVNKSIGEVSDKLELIPGGSTALLDAIGKTINNVGESLRAMPEYSRPSKVVVVIVTDGEENASVEFTIDRVKEMIQHQESVYSWQFVFMGANFNAYNVGAGLGMNVANCLTFAANNDGVSKSYQSLTSNMRSYREGSVNSMCFNPADIQAQIDAGAFRS